MSRMRLEQAELLSSGILYRGEGNANLVISLPDSRSVLRFPKSKYLDKSQAVKLETTARYINEIMLPRLAGWVDPVSIAQLSPATLEAVRQLVAPERPLSRRTKDVFYPAALLLPDHCLLPRPGTGPALAVEIKPKQGYCLASLPALRTRPQLCSFCLKQRYKAVCAEAGSQYCPLDLFSGDPARMVGAVRRLLAAPRNNLRIFRDGRLLHGEDSAAPATPFLQEQLGEIELGRVLVAALTAHRTAALSPDSALLPTPPTAPAPGDWVCSAGSVPTTRSSLPPGCILSSALALQRSAPRCLTDSQAEETLDSLLEAGLELAWLQSLVTSASSLNTSHLSKQQQEQVQMLKDYLVSVTAKDLSIIVTLVQDSLANSAVHKEGQWMKIGGKLFRVKLSVVDLDPKSLNRISKYVSQKKMWLESYEAEKL